MTTAYGYVRVSHERQAEEGVSLDAQRERIADYCRKQGWDCPTIGSDEGISGKRQDTRPGLQRILKAVCRDKGILVVYSLSRLTRSIRDLLDIFDRLDKAGANLVSLTESFDTTSAMGRFAFKLFGLVAELERELIGERTKAALDHKKANGERLGGRLPYGYTDEGGKLIPREDEQRVIASMIDWHENDIGYKAIAAELNHDSIPTRTGAPWSATVVRAIIKRHKEPARA